MAKKQSSSKKYLFRSDSNKIIAGVCAGIAEYFDFDPIIVRISLVAITLLGGSGVLIYIILWIVMPTKSMVGKNSEDNIRDNVEEIKTRARKIAGKDRKIILGLVLLILGFSFLMSNFGIIHPWYFSKLWPLIIIALGIAMLTKK